MVNGAHRNNYSSRVLVSTLRGRSDYIMLHFCGLLLGYVGDCTITHSAMVAMLVHPSGSLELGYSVTRSSVV